MTGLQVINEIEDRLSWPQTESIDQEPRTSETRKLLRFLNRVLQTITGTKDWPRLRATGAVILLASETSDLTSGSEQYVSISQNSDLMTVANGTFDETYIWRAIQVSGDEIVYRIKAVPSPTVLQLGSIWVNDDIVVGDERTFTIAMDKYALPTDFDRPLSEAQAFFEPYNIQPRSPGEFESIRRRDPGITVGDPDCFTIYGMNDGQSTELVHFHPYPENQRIINFEYQRVHPEINSDNDEVLFPQRFIAFIVETVEALALRTNEDDPNKMQATILSALTSYNQQIANRTVTGSRIRLKKTNRIRASIRRAFNKRGKMDWGDWFDRSNFYGLDR